MSMRCLHHQLHGGGGALGLMVMAIILFMGKCSGA